MEHYIRKLSVIIFARNDSAIVKLLPEAVLTVSSTDEFTATCVPVLLNCYL